ncbi:hypothetical protein SLEP1_g50784 [Rubroshorea leprosula]|uniref:Uncharacterized protein n=1 Tax=Rubroshorea leprosula TaxID=152421 RepID=A0AAV5M169_9ROSI|nr:hypothetical protein SLEP1_g50784 [Rubroshorea leprosula]
MKIDVQVISNQDIRPSSPTPLHLRRYQLSFLDQIAPPSFMPSVMFYPRENITNSLEPAEKLKKSLSEALTIFYPLAGRIKDNAYVDCNDQGVYFVEAKANCNMSDILDCRDPADNNTFIPLELDGGDELPLMVQLTHLECGGLVLSVGMSHKVSDALSFFMFINSWASMARGNADIINIPPFHSAVLFPPKDISGFHPRTGIVKENIMTKRFVFDASSVAILREKYAYNGKRPTRVEALSSFIWNRFMVATQPKTDEGKLYTVLHAVNLRPRMNPPLPNYYFGNLSRVAVTAPQRVGEDEFRSIVRKMSEAVKKVDAEYVKKLQETNGHLDFIKKRGQSVMKGEVVSFSFTSLCRFPVYEADFGWGKPVWVAAARLPFKNLVNFFDTKSGDGIEAWINLKGEDMVKFETDKELLSYVNSSSPNVKVSGAN